MIDFNRNKKNEITINDISDFFLTKSDLTPKKLQKLVYYAYAWFLALNNEVESNINNLLFKEKPEAWLHGPVFPTLYHKYKHFGWYEIPKTDKNIEFKNKDLISFLNDIWGKFGVYSADQLEYMTHCEEPWIKARRKMIQEEKQNEELNIKEIFNYYNGMYK